MLTGFATIVLAAAVSLGVAHADARKPHARGGHATFSQLTKAEQRKVRQADAKHVVPKPPAPGEPVGSGTWWKPKAETPLPLYWILSAPLSASDVLPAPAVFDIDGQDNSAAIVSDLHHAGAKVICYVDAGTWEPGRSDSSDFPASVQGSGVDGWPGEKWLDIRQTSTLAPIIQARFKTCKAKGFDAIEPDNIDGYSNNTGFPLTSADQLTYNRALAEWAHGLGLSIGLKNDGDQARALEPSFDWALDEECYTYNECGYLNTFTSANKAVWIAEYKSISAADCADSKANHFNTAQYDLNLGKGGRQPCA
jgi:Glycoside-hydrolase family GH114